MEDLRLPVTDRAKATIGEIQKVICGKDPVILWTLTAILAGGHILLEDIPGVGKTTLAVAFSKTMGLSYKRVQFTPDVLPSDITGYSVPRGLEGKLEYRPGAVLCNLFLADELNRATSRTQSALLEAMEEGQVTVDGVSHPVPQPFVVIATQNPAGAAGTQLLPDSQVDRFMIRLSLGYPDAKAEMQMLLNRQGKDPLASVEQVLKTEALQEMQQLVAETFVSEEIARYVVALIDATRRSELLLRGASPRGTLAVTRMAKAYARLRGRDYLVPGDIREVFTVTLAHRVRRSPEAESQGYEEDRILKKIFASVPAPELK